MAGRAAGTRSRGGLWTAVVGLVAAVGLVFAVSAATASRTHNSAKDGAPVTAAPGGQPSAAATTAAPIPEVKLKVVGAVKGVQPWSKPVEVHVSNGTIQLVKVTDDTGATLAGAVSGSSWISSGQVVPSRTYQIQLDVLGQDGVAAYHTLSVRTTPPASTDAASVNLQVGPAVGVGWPITVHFSSPVTNRAAVQNALQVQTSVPVTGAWHWFSDTEVHWRPEAYWPAHTNIILHRDLDAVEVAPGVWGTQGSDVAFNVGDSHVSTVDVATQHMTVTVNGTQVAYDKVSTGRPSLPTLGGVHIVLEKWASIVMDSETLKPPIPKLLPNGKKNPLAYDEKELWATRISNGGAFIHYNPDTLKVQGQAAASHGCVNTDLADAKQFYNLALPGDIVNVVNSPAPPNVTDPGMMDWNYSWADWIAGSATQS